MIKADAPRPLRHLPRSPAAISERSPAEHAALYPYLVVCRHAALRIQNRGRASRENRFADKKNGRVKRVGKKDAVGLCNLFGSSCFSLALFSSTSCHFMHAGL